MREFLRHQESKETRRVLPLSDLPKSSYSETEGVWFINETLTKYANVLMAAQLGKTSPYAMSRQELITYGKQINNEKGIQITDKDTDTLADAE